MLLPADLPPELILSVLVYLPLQSLHALRSLSREWHDWFDLNNEYIYQQAAFRHNFIPSANTTLGDAVEHTKHLLSHWAIENWREFCRFHFSVEANWAGYGDVGWQAFSMDQPDVHRIKVDEELGIIITTHQEGGLTVRDLDTNELLWALPPTYVRPYAHCEYQNGFLIFDRFGQAKEVWRLASQYDRSPIPPENVQHAVSHTINELMPPSKGHFIAWALFHAPDMSTAFRFVYPTLVVCGQDAAWLYDVLTCQFVKAIPNIQALVDRTRLGAVYYVELSTQYVIICGSNQLRIFDRSSAALVYVTSASPRPIARHTIEFCEQASPPRNGTVAITPLTGHVVTSVRESKGHHPFIAAHVDSNGETVVLLKYDGSVVVIKNISEVIKGEKTLEQNAVEIHLRPDEVDDHEPPGAVYLAVENGRASVVTTFGVFILTLDANHYSTVNRRIDLAGTETTGTPSNSTSQDTLAFPFIHCSKMFLWTKMLNLAKVSCLQMTPRRLFFTWNKQYLLKEDRKPEPGGQVGWAVGSTSWDVDWPPGEDEDEDEDEDEGEDQTAYILCIDMSTFCR